MKRTAFICVLAVLTSSTALPLVYGDAPATTQTAHTGPLQKLHEALAQLNLSGQQKAEIHKIIADARTKLAAIKSGGQTPNKSEVRPIVKAAIEDIMKDLGPEQKAKLRELLKEHRPTSGKI